MMLSIVIPVYKSRESLPELHRRLSSVLASLPRVSSYEIVFVEDRGEDGSWEVIEALAEYDASVTGLRLSRNFGQHNAITAGLESIQGDWCIVMDCDLQDQPEEIPLLWKKVDTGVDVINARRSGRRDSYAKRVSSRLFYIVFELCCGLGYDPGVANFRLMSRKVVDAIVMMPESTRALGAQVHWLGFTTATVDVSHGKRKSGRSSYTLARLFRLAFSAIVSYSNWPLQIATAIGMAVSAIALLAFFYVLVRALLWGSPVVGWASLMVSIWFLGGAIITTIGIVGVYVGRVFEETKRRPIFVVDRRVGAKRDVP